MIELELKEKDLPVALQNGNEIGVVRVLFDDRLLQYPPKGNLIALEAQGVISAFYPSTGKQSYTLVSCIEDIDVVSRGTYWDIKEHLGISPKRPVHNFHQPTNVLLQRTLPYSDYDWLSMYAGAETSTELFRFVQESNLHDQEFRLRVIEGIKLIYTIFDYDGGSNEVQLRGKFLKKMCGICL